jgi:hypothetical protein
MRVIPAPHLLINLQLEFDAATDSVPFRPHQDLCQTQLHGKGSVSTRTWALQPNRFAVFIFNPERAKGPSETPNSTYRVTQPHIPQDINQGMSAPDTLVGCQLMTFINIKVDHFSCCERIYRITTLSNYHKKYIFRLTEKHGSPLQRPITVCCLREKWLFIGIIRIIRIPCLHHIDKIQGF